MNVPTGFDYHPNADVLQKLRAITLVAAVGPSGSGKTTLMQSAAERSSQFHMVHNNTSRAPREGEQEGREFHFATRQEMEARIQKGEYAQVAPSLFGDLYATAPEDYSSTGISMLPIVADAMPIFRALPFKQVRSIFVVPPDYETWYARMTRHGFTSEQLQRRLREAQASLIYGLEDGGTHLLINLDLEVAIEDYMTLALGKPLPTRLRSDQSRGREILASLLASLRRSL